MRRCQFSAWVSETKEWTNHFTKTCYNPHALGSPLMVGHYACEERIHRLRDFESRLEGACINGGQSESRSALRPFLNRLRQISQCGRCSCKLFKFFLTSWNSFLIWSSCGSFQISKFLFAAVDSNVQLPLPIPRSCFKSSTQLEARIWACSTQVITYPASEK